MASCSRAVLHMSTGARACEYMYVYVCVALGAMGRQVHETTGSEQVSTRAMPMPMPIPMSLK